MKVAAVLQKKGHHVHTIHPAASVADAANSLAGPGIGALVVTITGGDRGLISIGDVVKNRIQEVELEQGVLRDCYIAGR